MDHWKVPTVQAIEAYGKTKTPTLTEQLLAGILAQLEKANHQLSQLVEDKEEKG